MPKIFAFALVVFYGFSVPAHAEIARFFQVAPGIYRGSQPQERADYDRLKAVGVKTILNLQLFGVEDEQEMAKDMAFNFYHVGMNASPIAPSVDTVNQALDVLTNPSLQPVFVHCTLGRDRTGMVIALYRIYYEGWKSADAYAEWRKFGYPGGFFLSGLEHYFHEHDDPSRRYSDDGLRAITEPSF